MSRRASPGERGDGDGEAARYRRAATEALKQLDWCIEYFRRIQKRKLAARLAQNRRQIADRAFR